MNIYTKNQKINPLMHSQLVAFIVNALQATTRNRFVMFYSYTY